MTSETEFETLLRKPEGETIDFKATPYELSSDHGKFSFVKDVICLANTPREQDALIVLGVKKHADGKYDILGSTTHPDEADLQSQFAERVYPVPRLSYEILSYNGKQFGLIRIPCERIGQTAAPTFRVRIHSYARAGSWTQL